MQIEMCVRGIKGERQLGKEGMNDLSHTSVHFGSPLLSLSHFPPTCCLHYQLISINRGFLSHCFTFPIVAAAQKRLKQYKTVKSCFHITGKHTASSFNAG